eukprot:2121700-Rhodomonas_salina.7
MRATPTLLPRICRLRSASSVWSFVIVSVFSKTLFSCDRAAAPPSPHHHHIAFTLTPIESPTPCLKHPKSSTSRLVS